MSGDFSLDIPKQIEELQSQYRDALKGSTPGQDKVDHLKEIILQNKVLMKQIDDVLYGGELKKPQLKVVKQARASCERLEKVAYKYLDDSSHLFISEVGEGKIERIVHKTWDGIVKWFTVQVAEGYFPLFVKREKGLALEAKYQKLAETEGPLQELIKVLISPSNEDMPIIRESITDWSKWSAKEKREALEELKEQSAVGQGVTVGDLNPVMKEVASIYKSRDYWAKLDKARQAIISLGGERVELQPPDKAKLDGVYVEGRAFRQKIVDHGGALATITRTSPDGSQKQLKGIIFSRDDFNKHKAHILETLKEFDALSENSGRTISGGAGWSVVQHGEDYLLVPTQQLDLDRPDSLVRYSGGRYFTRHLEVIPDTAFNKDIFETTHFRAFADKFADIVGKLELPKGVSALEFGKVMQVKLQLAVSHTFESLLQKGEEPIKENLLRLIQESFASQLEKTVVSGKTVASDKWKDNVQATMKLLLEGSSWQTFIDETDMELFKTKEPVTVEKTALDTETESQSTIIITSGSEGPYEALGDDAFAFLMKGMNVFLFNSRDRGKSQGVLSKANVETDYETAYQFVRERTGHEDKQILWKAMCFGGGPAAKVAANHPEMNLLLCQTYSDMHVLVEDGVQARLTAAVDELKEKLSDEELNKVVYGLKYLYFKMYYTLLAPVAKLLFPGFTVAKHLAENKGYKAFFYTHDETIPISHLKRNFEAVAKAGQLEMSTVISAPGTHESKWFEVGNSPKDIVAAAQEIEAAEEKAKDYLKKLEGTASSWDTQNKIIERRKALEKELQEIVKRYENLPKKAEPAVSSPLFDGRFQMDAFLEKAHLLDNIVK